MHPYSIVAALSCSASDMAYVFSGWCHPKYWMEITVFLMLAIMTG